MIAVISRWETVAICPDRPDLGPAGLFVVIPTSVSLLLSVLFRTLSTAEVRIESISCIGVYLGFLFGFGASQAGPRCMHVAVVTVPSPYPFLLSPGLLEVHRFSLLPLIAVHRAFTLAPVVFIILVALFILHCTPSHTLDRVPRPLIRNGRRSRPAVPHQLL